MKQDISFVNLTDKQRIRLSQEMAMHINKWLSIQYARLVKLGVLPKQIFALAESDKPEDKKRVTNIIAHHGITWQPLFGDRDFGAVLLQQGREISRLNMKIKREALLKSRGNLEANQ